LPLRDPLQENKNEGKKAFCASKKFAVACQKLKSNTIQGEKCVIFLVFSSQTDEKH
jgi:hypothetical protein